MHSQSKSIDWACHQPNTNIVHKEHTNFGCIDLVKVGCCLGKQCTKQWRRTKAERNALLCSSRRRRQISNRRWVRKSRKSTNTLRVWWPGIRKCIESSHAIRLSSPVASSRYYLNIYNNNITQFEEMGLNISTGSRFYPNVLVLINRAVQFGPAAWHTINSIARHLLTMKKLIPQ